MIRAIIFDCFGVLITDALQAITDELRAKNPAGVSQIHDLVHASNRGLIDRQTFLQGIADVLDTTPEGYRQLITSGEVKNHALFAYIRELRDQYKIGMLSNISSTDRLRARFSADELREHFDTVVASGDIGYAKPEAQAYEIVADQLGVRLDECVMIDDREGYCDGARGVGMKAILYTDFAQFQRDIKALLANT